jgi:hypothetical protein
LESAAVKASSIATAAFEATTELCKSEGLVYVPIDASSLTLMDRARKRELGRVGNSLVKSRGLHVMSSMAVDGDGVTIGLLDQQWWARDQPPKKRRGNDRKCFSQKFMERETRFWIQAVTQADDRLHAGAPKAIAWYQLDRGADCWPVFKLALERELLLTVRAAHNRRLVQPDKRTVRLYDVLERQPVLGRYELEVPARSNRPSRKARIAVRATQVLISARVGSRRRDKFQLNAVLAEEEGGRPGERIRWVLLTTHSIATFEQAKAVTAGYAMRWRIEEFHRAWKRGVCNVEDTQLQSRSAIVKWATILATVAARAVRLAYLVRTSPEVPASAHFSQYEIDAAYLLVKQKRDRRRRASLRTVIDMIAQIGGFAHKYSQRLPGPTIIGRGLDRVQVLATGLQNMDEMR